MSAGTCSNFLSGVTDRVIRRKRIVQSPVSWVIFSIGLAPNPIPQVLMSFGVEPKNFHSSQASGTRQAMKTTTLSERIMKAALGSRLLALLGVRMLADKSQEPGAESCINSFFSDPFPNTIQHPARSHSTSGWDVSGIRPAFFRIFGSSEDGPHLDSRWDKN